MSVLLEKKFYIKGVVVIIIYVLTVMGYIIQTSVFFAEENGDNFNFCLIKLFGHE